MSQMSTKSHNVDLQGEATTIREALDRHLGEVLDRCVEIDKDGLSQFPGRPIDWNCLD